MRIFHNNTNNDSENTPIIPVLFTGSSIAYLTNINTSINLSEWQWHEEVIDGRRTRIVTDKLHDDFEIYPLGTF
ncbi:hypothetical protein U0035_12740 [Niabella yanshanensis]|uniref:Uncharacterized protein n=1 Tax=Niabella yanshanensis TaxID=577386 RepID=A0ABZ0W0T6_9BACT|nr:hypothetical protein [Niabella yanshanensis]WQD36534.1 hypothetical protein U0035_12740 [Niabella yanshanensis]